MANPLGNECKNANTHTHGGIGIFTKEMKLELMWINSAMKRRREGLKTPPADSPTVPPAPYIEKTGSHRVDRTLVTQ